MNFFRRISSIIIPTVYEDALSYSEMVRRLGQKVNELINWVNNTKFVNSINGRTGDVNLATLRFTGYSQEEYNGSENVTVRIPTGVGPTELGTLRVQYSDGTKQDYDGSESITIPGGGVEKVNGKTGVVVLTASDVGALPTSKEQTGIKNPMALRLIKGDTYYDYDGSQNVTVTIPEGGTSGGVTSVNGQTGTVTLDANDVNALPNSVTALPNPNALTIFDPNNNTTINYNGAENKFVTLPLISGGTSGGGVTSVNGQTGAVQLNADSVGAVPAGYLQTGIKNPNALTITIDGTTSQQYDGSSPVSINLTSGGEVSGVTSVNGQTGVVVLDAEDVGAIPTGGKAVNPNVINFSGYYTGQYDGSQQANVSIPNKVKVGTPLTGSASVGANSFTYSVEAGLYAVEITLPGFTASAGDAITNITGITVLLASDCNTATGHHLPSYLTGNTSFLLGYISSAFNCTFNQALNQAGSFKFTKLTLGV